MSYYFSKNKKAYKIPRKMTYLCFYFFYKQLIINQLQKIKLN
jgi:hypothetical protein